MSMYSAATMAFFCGFMITIICRLCVELLRVAYPQITKPRNRKLTDKEKIDRLVKAARMSGGILS